MNTPSQNLHVYEVIGESVIRVSGTGMPRLCKIVRTRAAFAEPHEQGFRVAIADISSGYQYCYLPNWFSDWTEEYNIQNGDMQSGRPVDIAFTTHDFEAILADGSPREIVAVRVGNRWVIASRLLENKATSV